MSAGKGAGNTPQKLAETGTEAELFEHFLIKPMRATAASLVSATEEDRERFSSRSVIISKAESVRSDAGDQTLLSILLARMADIPPQFKLVLVIRRDPPPGVEGTPGCKVVRLSESSPAFQANLDDMVEHLTKKLGEHQRALPKSRLDRWLATSGQSALPSEADFRRLAHEIVVVKGRGNFQYAMRILRLLGGRSNPLDIRAEAEKLPDGEQAALESLLVEKYLQADTTAGSLRATAEYNKIRPVLEVLVAAQGQLTRDDLVEVLCLSQKRLDSSRDAQRWRAIISRIDPQLASINAAQALPIKGTVFEMLCGSDVTHRSSGHVSRDASGSLSGAALLSASGGGGDLDMGKGGAGELGVDVGPPPAALQRRSSQVDRLEALHISQVAGHNMLAAWCVHHHDRIKNACRDEGNELCRRIVGTDEGKPYSESAFHLLPPYVLQHINVHLETAVRNSMKRAWPFDRS